jgi:site-specific recombinase XerD
LSDSFSDTTCFSFSLTNAKLDNNQLAVAYRLHALNENGIRGDTIHGILRTVELLTSMYPSVPLLELTTEQIRTCLFTYKEERNWTAKTFINKRQQLRSFFQFCIVRDFLNENPVSKIAKPKLPRPTPRFLTKEQVSQVFQSIRWIKWTYSIETIRNETIIATFIYTGIRLNELRNLTVSDVNLHSREVLIRHGKGDRDRLIPIHPSLFPYLANYIEQCTRLKQTSTWFFFGVRTRSRMNKKQIGFLCKKIGKQCGVTFTPHQLRHTFGRLSIDGGLGLYQVKEIMGHADVSTTQLYLSVSKEGLRKALSAVHLL